VQVTILIASYFINYHVDKSANISKPVCSPDACNSSGLIRWFWLYAQLHYFLNFSQLLVSCLPLLAKLI